MRKLICVLIVCLMLVSMTGCGNDLKQYHVNDDIVFISVYRNAAWGFQFRGTAIYDNGHIVSFALTENKYYSMTTDKDENTQEFQKELLEYVSSRPVDKAVTLSAADVASNYLIFLKVDPNAEFTSEQNRNDYGQNTYYGVTYDERGNGVFTEIYSFGDYIRTMQDANAQKVAKWIVDSIGE